MEMESGAGLGHTNADQLGGVPQTRQGDRQAICEPLLQQPLPSLGQSDSLAIKLYMAYCQGRKNARMYGHGQDFRRLREIWFYVYMGKSDSGWTLDRLKADVAYDLEMTRHWPQIYSNETLKGHIEAQQAILHEIAAALCPEIDGV